VRFDSPLEVPRGDSPERSSAGIIGPYQILADDDDLDLEVADSTIIELEDGFLFQLASPPEHDESGERAEVFGYEALRELSNAETGRPFLERNWLVGQGEN
jgi:hypothetical protein